MAGLIGTSYPCLGCSTRTIITTTTNTISLLCSDCHTVVCLHCREEGHFPASCEDHAFWKMADDDIDSFPEEVKTVYDRVNKLSDDIDFFGTYRQWKLNHNDATRERHPQLKDAENELVAMYHMMRWCYISYLRKHNILGEGFLQLVLQVKAGFDNLFKQYPEPVPEVPSGVDDDYPVLTGPRANAAGGVSRLLQSLIDFYPRAYLDPSRAHLLRVLRTEKAKWDQIMHL